MVAVVLVVVNCIIMPNTVMIPMKHALLSVVEFPSPRHSKQMLAILPKSVAVRYMNDKTEIFDGLRGQLGDSGRARPWPRAFSDHCFNCDHIVVHFCKFRGSKSTQHTPGAVHVRGSHASILAVIQHSICVDQSHASIVLSNSNPDPNGATLSYSKKTR